MDRLGADLDAWTPDPRQTARNRGHGPHRPGSRPSSQGFRLADPLSQPAARRRPDRGNTRSDLLGIARSDARPHGHRFGQLSAYARDVSFAVGATAKISPL